MFFLFSQCAEHDMRERCKSRLPYVLPNALPYSMILNKSLKNCLEMLHNTMSKFFLPKENTNSVQKRMQVITLNPFLLKVKL